ncbi:MAG: Glycine-rich cell wall structural protein precursor [Labilithrix sp.]|nr:Glycine-rich cell wall structural protein precursor [Labilithrix sp.]
MDGGTSGGPEGGADVNVPDGCDAAAEPKDAPKCVVNDFGVFADANGNDANAGTKESPVKTITAALGKLAGKTRVYVCEGTYAEHVKLTTAVSVYGGFACSGWDYTGAKPKVAPTDAGYAVEVEKVASAVEIVDVSFTSAAGTEAATSSVAAFVKGSPSLTLRRVALTAGKGFAGKSPAKAADGALMSSMPTASSLDGNKGDAANGGLAQLCTCVGGGTSKGGGGGSLNSNGNPGETAQPTPDPVFATGAGQTQAERLMAGAAKPGSNAPNAPAGAGAATLGAITEAGWAPSGGTKGP